MKTHVLIGTAKGLVVYRKQGQSWIYDQHHFLGMSVSRALENPHDGSWWVCLDHKHWGPKIQVSSDQGVTWREHPAPKYPESAELTAGVPATLRYLWTLEFGLRPGQIFLGTQVDCLKALITEIAIN